MPRTKGFGGRMANKPLTILLTQNRLLAKNIFSIDNQITEGKLLSDHFGVVVDFENKKSELP